MIDLEGMFYKKYVTTSSLIEEVGILYLLTFAGYAYSYLRLYPVHKLKIKIGLVEKVIHF